LQLPADSLTLFAAGGMVRHLSRRMVRVPAGAWLAAVLGVAGLAMAQDDLIVDPWKRALSSLLAPWPADPAPGVDRTRHAPSAALSPITTKAAPAVVPVGPPLSLSTEPWGVLPVGPAKDGVVDPWAEPRAATLASVPSHPVATRRGRADWAREIDEIVDPWSQGPLAAATDPLIIDPWAR
jgi:hypothetical protein